MTVIKDPRTSLGAFVVGDGRLRTSSVAQTREAFETTEGNSYIVSSDIALNGGAYVPPVSGSYLAYVTNNSKTQNAIVTELVLSAEASVGMRFRIEAGNTIGTPANNIKTLPFNDLLFDLVPTDLDIEFWSGLATFDGISNDGHAIISGFLPGIPVSINTNSSRVIPPNKTLAIWASGNGISKLSFAVRFILEDQLSEEL